jgi:hypothetical protein
LKQTAIVGLFAAALAVSGAGKAQNLVQNPDFTTTSTPNVQFNQNPTASNVPDWTNYGPDTFIYGPGGADTIGANGIYLWGPANGGPTAPGVIMGIPTQVLPPTSPKDPGTNYLATDADPNFHGAITQALPTGAGPGCITATTLCAGQSYVLNFDYAAAQFRNQSGSLWNGAAASAWQVSLGGTPLTNSMSQTVPSPIGCGGNPSSVPCTIPAKSITTTTPVLMIPSHGFSGWQEASVTFTAATSGLLSFLAQGPGPDSLPPVALLDSVSILPACGSGSVASYIGTTCAIGDKEFSNFHYTSTAIGSAVASNAAQTTITPVMSGNNYGFNIQGDWAAGPGGGADGLLSYTVQSLAGATIDDASLSLTGSAFGGGFATVGETICQGDLLSDGCASGTSATLQGYLPGAATENIMFPMATDLVDISKDIDVFGGSGFASLSDVIDTVSQCVPNPLVPCLDPPDPPTVPEPPSLALLGVGLGGLAGVGLVRRRRCSVNGVSGTSAAL